MTLVFDIDGTIIYSIFNKEKNMYETERFDCDLVDKINDLYSRGIEIILFTGRHWNNLGDTIIQLSKIGLKYTALQMGKPVGYKYIDNDAMTTKEFLEMDL